jgi:2-polyprenyl-6-hydroxyphenyl methylase/3-demethylubiquinone-9 3-methyltransferase
MIKNTKNNSEIEKFSKIAQEWWDPVGKFRPLHKFNPCRIDYIRKKIINHFAIISDNLKCLNNLNIIDIGCGGGLVSEPMAKLGANVTAIDASEKNIKIAQAHAQESNLKIDYKVSAIEELSKKYHNKFDVVLALEIIEHVDDVSLFVSELKNLVKKDGIIFIATINRTIKSLLTAKIGAEYILRWLPIGTHDFKKFLKPYEIVSLMEDERVQFNEISGFEYNLLKDEWRNSNNNDVNYILSFIAKDES